MGSPITASIATQSRQLIGYWGYGNPAIFAQQLHAIIQQFSPDEWVIQADCANQDIRVAISASGLYGVGQSPETQLADVWVQLQEQQLRLERNLFGRVTLYWTQIEQVIWFATRLQLLLPLLTVPEVSIPGLYGYSCFSYVPTPLTPIANLVAIPAGTEQVWQRHELAGRLSALPVTQSCEWRESSEQIHDEAAAIADLQTLLRTAVERQLTDIQDQPVGVFLSGGLDSSIVAALLVQMGVNVYAYTLDFGTAGTPEYPYAEQVAQHLQIPLIKVDATPRRVQQALESATLALDLPFGDAVTVPLFLLNQAASQDTAIVFNGEGGDQLFAGWTNKPLIAASIYRQEILADPALFANQYLQTFHRLWGYEIEVFQPRVYEQIQSIQPQAWLQEALDPTCTRSLLHQLRRATLMLKGAQNIQPRATNLAFAQGLWVRSPFCDPSLAAWTFQLSGELCLKGACEKYILKRAVESWLPTEIVWRQKRGMGVPTTSWCLQEWWRALGQWLNPAVLQAEGIWQADLAERVISGKLGGAIQGRRIGEILWLLITWQTWRSQVLGETVRPTSWEHPFWLPPWVWHLRSISNFLFNNNYEV
ncbi:asparagine synthetase B family protein [Pantanalinema sp. GBBB05]|uniref:asparagine synthetase B family protein n=1 Tax=Pantanalinema sp. GBBB05 TaxID=2604139 RepID=UPI001D339EE9|nr:asparagine synthase [Pantanalinema sp. GBBB05]